MRRALIRMLGAITILPLSGGCGTDLEYLIPVVSGQATILMEAVPISEALRSGELSEEQTAKLILLRDVRSYAGREMGLNTTDNYTLFFDAGEGPVAYNVSAAPKYELRAKNWGYPVVGVLPYIGYFDRAAARAEFNSLKADGYDVFMYEVDAYSTLEYFPNPILSPMLDRSDLSLIDTVIHELLHATVWHDTDTTFNESLATFAGRTGAVEYLAANHPDDPDRVREAREHYEDTDTYNAFMAELFNELDEYYSSGQSREERIAGREEVYQAGRDRFVRDYLPLMNNQSAYDWVETMPTNNAWMLSNRRYNYDLDLFARVYEAAGSTWPEALRVFRAAARAKDPHAYLDSWLSQPQTLKQGADNAATDAPATARGLCRHTTYMR